MSIWLRCVLGLGVLLYFACIIHLLKKKSLTLKYSLLWLASGIIMSLLVLFPGILNAFVAIVDIKSPINGLFSICIFAILVILMSLTSIVSKQSNKIKNLVQYIAILEKKIREFDKER